MPSRASRSCVASDCPGRAQKGSRYCLDHAHLNKPARKPDTRPSAAARGYDRKWRRIRAQFIKKHPECAICGEPTQEVDHIIPLSNGGSNRWDNLQPLCKTHHSQKTVYLDGGFGLGRGDQKV